MGLFSALTKIVIDVATLPIDIAKDALTLGGIATEQDKPYTLQKLDQIKKDSEDVD
jgi:hypothetical protein